MSDISKATSLAETFGIENANRFLEAGWIVVDIDRHHGSYDKYVMGWPEKGKPSYPKGLTNPLTRTLKAIDDMMEAERKKYEG